MRILYKLLIVDDEKPVREALKIYLKRSNLAFEPVWEASDGLSGLDIIARMKPHVVLADMKMPGMDGLEMIERMSKLSPESKCIVISGYDDFEYLRRSLQLQVLDYLLKPLEEQEVRRILQKAIDLLVGEQETVLEGHRNSIAGRMGFQVMQEKFYESLLSRPDRMPPVYNELRSRMSFDPEGKQFLISVLSILNLAEILKRKFLNDASTCHFAICNVINELGGEFGWCFSFKSSFSQQEFVVLSGINPQTNVQQGTELVNHAMQRIAVKLEEIFGAFCIAAMGNLQCKLLNIGMSYMLAEDRLNATNLLSEKSGKKEAVVSPLLKHASLIERRDLMLNAFESGSKETMKKIIEEYFSEIDQTGYFSLEDARMSATELVLLIQNMLNALNMSELYDLKRWIRNGQLLVPMNTFEEFRGFIEQTVFRTFDQISNRLKFSEQRIIYEIKQFIEQNFFREITLQLFSDKYYFSKEHLSRKFKDEFHYGIYEYVLKIRMEKALTMLKDANVRIQTIAEKVGYNDNNYFSKAFKKYYGYSPSEYRKGVGAE